MPKTIAELIGGNMDGALVEVDVNIPEGHLIFVPILSQGAVQHKKIAYELRGYTQQKARRAVYITGLYANMKPGMHQPTL